MAFHEVDGAQASKVLSVRLSPEELADLDQVARAKGVGRAEVIRSLLAQGRLPRRATATVPAEIAESRRVLIDGVNRACKQLERTAEILEAQSEAGQIDGVSLDRAAWQLSAVDADLREALRDDRTD